jgi:hypothetical protein
MTDTMTSKNTDLSSWTLKASLKKYEKRIIGTSAPHCYNLGENYCYIVIFVRDILNRYTPQYIN